MSIAGSAQFMKNAEYMQCNGTDSHFICREVTLQCRVAAAAESYRSQDVFLQHFGLVWNLDGLRCLCKHRSTEFSFSSSEALFLFFFTEPGYNMTTERKTLTVSLRVALSDSGKGKTHITAHIEILTFTVQTCCFYLLFFIYCLVSPLFSLYECMHCLYLQ